MSPCIGRQILNHCAIKEVPLRSNSVNNSVVGIFIHHFQMRKLKLGKVELILSLSTQPG